jgi:hypothetical protein
VTYTLDHWRLVTTAFCGLQAITPRGEPGGQIGAQSLVLAIRMAAFHRARPLAGVAKGTWHASTHPSQQILLTIRLRPCLVCAAALAVGPPQPTPDMINRLYRLCRNHIGNSTQSNTYTPPVPTTPCSRPCMPRPRAAETLSRCCTQSQMWPQRYLVHNWVALGDFNREPDSLTNTGIPRPAYANRPYQATH